MTGLHGNQARSIWRSLPRLLPRSVVRSDHGIVCRKTMGILEKYNKNKVLTEYQTDPKSGGDSYSDYKSTDLSSLTPQDSRSESKTDQLSTLAAANEDRCPHKTIIELYHEHTPCRRVRTWNGQRPGLLRTLWREHPDLEWWAGFFQYVSESDFLCGRTQPRNGSTVFLADLEWLIRPNNFQKINEGKYHRVQAPDTRRH